MTGTSGNVSARDPETGLIAVSPTSIPYDRIGPEHVSVVDPEGELLEGGSAERRACRCTWPSSPGDRRPRRIVHTHSPYATAVGLVLDEIPVVLAEQAAAVGGPIPVVPYAPTGERAMGEAVLACRRCVGRDRAQPRPGVPGQVAGRGASLRVRGRGGGGGLRDRAAARRAGTAAGGRARRGSIDSDCVRELPRNDLLDPVDRDRERPELLDRDLAPGHQPEQ